MAAIFQIFEILKWISLNENVWISIKISLKSFLGPFNNIPALVQMVVDKPSSEPMMVSLLMHICVSWPQWIKTPSPEQNGELFVG